MKRLTIVMSVLMIAANLMAQQDPKEKKFLDKLSQTTRSYKTIQIDFFYAWRTKEHKPDQRRCCSIEREELQVAYACGQYGYFCDGTTIWSYLYRGKECNITGVEDDKEGSLNPANIFTIYEKGFNYS